LRTVLGQTDNTHGRLALIARQTRRLRLPYSITYKPRTEIHGIGPTTASLGTAAAAWAFIQHLEASDEIVTTIRGTNGQVLDKRQLQELARNANWTASFLNASDERTTRDP
jgi:hypothetical protein